VSGMTKEDWNYQFGFVSEHLEHLGYGVVEAAGVDDHVEFDDRVVYINSRYHAETRFYTLLHELGHVDIYENTAAEFEADHPMYYMAGDGRTERSNAAKVSIVAEEIEAWKRGRWFARYAGLDLDEDKYNKHMTEALMSYINWAAGR